jgi:hypothetical protein
VRSSSNKNKGLEFIKKVMLTKNIFKVIVKQTKNINFV